MAKKQRLPRKLKKKLYGKKGKRKHLCLMMIENKEFKKHLFAVLNNTNNLDKIRNLYKEELISEQKEFIWNIQTINKDENN